MPNSVFAKVFEYMASLTIIFIVYFTVLYVLDEFLNKCKYDELRIIATIGALAIFVVGFTVTLVNL